MAASLTECSSVVISIVGRSNPSPFRPTCPRSRGDSAPRSKPRRMVSTASSGGKVVASINFSSATSPVDGPGAGERAKGTRGLPEGGVPLAFGGRRNLGNLGFQRNLGILRDCCRICRLAISARDLLGSRLGDLRQGAFHEIVEQPVGWWAEHPRQQVVVRGAIRVHAEDRRGPVAIEDLAPNRPEQRVLDP